jgi:branched-chain amino acid transport system permease protein
MERGLIKYFYKRPHADQILVTFGLAIVLQEIIKYFFGANPIPTPAPEAFAGSFDFGALIGSWTRSDHLSLLASGLFRLCRGRSSARCSPSCNSPPSAWWCAPAWPTGKPWACSASTSTSALPSCSPLPRCVAGLAGVMYTPINSPNYHMGMDFLVLSFVVVVVGGMGSLPGARCWPVSCSGFWKALRPWRRSFRPASRHQPDHHLSRRDCHPAHPSAGLMGRKGVMED